MFNFSANHLVLISRTEYRSCAVFLMKDDSTHRVYRSADKLYLVIESVKPDTKHRQSSTAPAPADGAEE